MSALFWIGVSVGVAVGALLVARRPEGLGRHDL
jgi:hypothetical protein